MSLSEKQKITIYMVLSYLFALVVDLFITIGRLNVESWAQENSYDKLYKLVSGPPEWMVMVWDAITGSFGLGFVLGSLLFAFWDPLARYGEKLFNLGKKHHLRFSGPTLIRSDVFSCGSYKDRHIYKNFYIVSVQNADPKAKTIRNVSLKAAIIGPPEKLPLENGSYDPVDIPPGDSAIFTFGHLLAEDMYHLVRGTKSVKKSDFEKMIDAAKYTSIRIPFEGGETGVSMYYPEGMREEDSTHAEFPLRLWFTADDIEPLCVFVTMTPDDEKKIAFETRLISQSQ